MASSRSSETRRALSRQHRSPARRLVRSGAGWLAWLSLTGLLLLGGCQQEQVRPVRIAETPPAPPASEPPAVSPAPAPEQPAREPTQAAAEPETPPPLQPAPAPLPTPTLIEPSPRGAERAARAAPKGIAATQLEQTAPEERPLFRQDRSNLDPSSPSYRYLQEPEEAMADFPVDRYGQIDWVATLDAGLIEPRTSLHNDRPMELRSDEIIMKNTQAMPWVLFPHRQHTEWLACSNCHPKPFKEQAGAAQITMDSIMRGQHCGQCHEKVSFSIMQCERCHSVLHPGSPKAWW